MVLMASSLPLCRCFCGGPKGEEGQLEVDHVYDSFGYEAQPEAPAARQRSRICFTTVTSQTLRGVPLREGELWLLSAEEEVALVQVSLYVNGFAFTHKGLEHSFSLSPFALVRNCKFQATTAEGVNLADFKCFKVSLFTQGTCFYFGIRHNAGAAEADAGHAAEEERSRWVVDMSRALRLVTQSLFPPFQIVCQPLYAVGMTATRLMAGYLVLHDGAASVSVLYCELHPQHHDYAKLLVYENDACQAVMAEIFITEHTACCEKVGISCSCFSVEDYLFSARSLAERKLWLRAISNVKVKLQNRAPSPTASELRSYREAIEEHVRSTKLTLHSQQASMDALLDRFQHAAAEGCRGADSPKAEVGPLVRLPPAVLADAVRSMDVSAAESPTEAEPEPPASPAGSRDSTGAHEAGNVGDDDGGLPPMGGSRERCGVLERAGGVSPERHRSAGIVDDAATEDCFHPQPDASSPMRRVGSRSVGEREAPKAACRSRASASDAGTDVPGADEAAEPSAGAEGVDSPPSIPRPPPAAEDRARRREQAPAPPGLSFCAALDQPLRGVPIREGDLWLLAAEEEVALVHFSLYVNGFAFTHKGQEHSYSLAPFSLVRNCKFQASTSAGVDLCQFKCFKVLLFTHAVHFYFGIKAPELGEREAEDWRSRWVVDISRAIRLVTQSLFPPFKVSCQPVSGVDTTRTRIMAGYLVHHDDDASVASVLYCELHPQLDEYGRLRLYEDDSCKVIVSEITITEHTTCCEKVGISCSCFSVDDRLFSTRTLAERKLWLRAISNVKVKVLNHAPSPTMVELQSYRVAIQEQVQAIKGMLPSQATMEALLDRHSPSHVAASPTRFAPPAGVDDGGTEDEPAARPPQRLFGDAEVVDPVHSRASVCDSRAELV